MDIRLGLDIGTQYSYASYSYSDSTGRTIVKELEFGKGIPTEVCYDDKKQVKCGDEVYEYYNNKSFDGCYKLSNDRCLKEAMRTCTDHTAGLLLYWYNKKGDRCDRRYVVTLQDMMQSFLEYFKGRIEAKLKSLNYRIVFVTVAFPNVKPGVEVCYQQQLKRLISEIFLGSQDGNNVNVYQESTCTADLLKRLYSRPMHDPPQNICSIDVGAGTTDFSYMVWDNTNRKYNDVWTGSCAFGGKIIDNNLSTECDIRDCHLMEKRKRWLYNDDNKTYREKKCRCLHDVKTCPLYNSKDDMLKIGNDSTTHYKSIVSTNNGNDYAELKSQITKLLTHVENTEDIQFILSGGSSVLPLVRETINSVMKDTGRIYKIGYLQCLAEGNDFSLINNSTFMSVAAALIGTSDVNRKIKTYSSPYTYAFKYRKEGESGYLIINPAKTVCCDDSGKLYYLFKEETVKNGTTVQFRLGDALLAIEKEGCAIMEFVSKKEGVTEIGQDKISYSGFKSNQQLKAKEYLIGVIVDLEEDVSKQLSAYIYDPDNTRLCYCGDEKQIDFNEFQKKAIETAEILKDLGVKGYKEYTDKLVGILKSLKK